MASGALKNALVAAGIVIQNHSNLSVGSFVVPALTTEEGNTP